jgi:catechol 2,3-dioxygenase-like lactoylglutathione lyase family enzyme
MTSMRPTLTCGKGVEFFIEPKNVGDIRLAFFRDPDGNELELFQSPTLTWSNA